MGLPNKSWWVQANRNSLVIFVNNDVPIYFDRFEVVHIPKDNSKIFIGNKNIIANIYRIQENDSAILEYFCIGFTNFMLKGKYLLDCTNLFFLKIRKER